MSSSSSNTVVYKPIKNGELQQKLKEQREYPMWKTNIMIVLMANNMSELFNRLVTSNANVQLVVTPEEKRGQAIIYEFIWRNIDKSLHTNLGAHLVASIGEVKPLWNLIIDRFESKTTANLYIVEEEFNNLKWDPIKQTIDDYEAVIVNLSNQIKNLGGQEPSDSRKLLALVKGLPDSYESIANNILTTQTKFNEAVAALRIMEKTRAVKREKDKMIEKQHEDLHSHLVKQSSNNHIKRWCDVCDKDNHNTKDCYRVKAMKSQRQNRGDKNSPRKDKDHKKADLQDVKCHNCGGIGHYANKCSSVKRATKGNNKEKTLHTEEGNDSEEGQNSDTESEPKKGHMTATNNSSKTDSVVEFKFDTGANTHCTFNKSLLRNVVELKKPVKITTQGKEPMEVSVIGEVQLKFGNQELILKDVRYHPEFTENLFSWSAFHKHNDIDLKNIISEYDDDYWSFSRKDNSMVFLKMELKGGLYTIVDGSMEALLGDRALISRENLRSAKKIEVPEPTQEQSISVVDNSTSSTEKQAVIDTHQLFGHMSNKQINKIINNKAMKGIEDAKLPVLKDNSVCSECMIGKGTRNPFKKHSEHDSANCSGERLYNDTSGPIEVVDKDEAYGMRRGKYLSLIVDEFSRLCNGRLVMTKDGATKHVKEFIPQAEKQTSNKVRFFHSDGGGEYINDELKQFLKSRGIQSEVTCSYTPQHNGVAERANRTIWETALTIVAAARLDKKKYLGEALHHAVYLWNCTVRDDEEKSRNELWNGTKVAFNKIHPFGCDAYATIPKELRKKTDDKVYKCIYLGNDEDHIGGYRCLDVENKKLIISRDVKFNDYSFTFGRSVEGGAADIEKKAIEQMESKSLIEMNRVMLDSNKPPSNSQSTISKNKNQRQSTERRSSRQRQQTQRYGRTDANDYYYEDIAQVNYVSSVFKAMEMLSNNELANEPLTYQEAIHSDECEEWVKANKSELNSLEKNDTWELVNVPHDTHTIKCKWVYKKKPDLQGNVARYKARLVAKGFTQIYGVDYKETYAPVGKIKSLLMLLSLANQLGYELNHLDVETAFLNAKVEEEILMDIPEGYHIENAKMKELLKKNPKGKIVLKLLKSIYGIKQAPHNWNELLNKSLTEKLNFTRLKSDSCIYVKKSKSGKLMFIFVWVDDMLGIYSPDDKVEWSELKSQLMSDYKIKDMGDVQMILGMRVTRDRENEIIRIDQGLYIDKILKKFSMQDCKPVSTPETTVSLSEIISNEMNESDIEYMKTVPYREAIGALLYAAICTRPDIAHAVNQVSQYQINPTPTHWMAVKRIMRYLKSCPNLGLEFKGSDKSNLQLQCYCDANWAQDRFDRRSVGGYLVRLNKDVISWQVRKQSIVALSSTEAEYMQMTQAAKEIKWFINLFSELQHIGQSQYYVPHIDMLCDNQSAIELSKNDIYHDRTKHIDLRYHFIRECVQQQLFNVHYVPTAEQQADIFTKGLQKQLFTKFRNMIMCNNDESKE